MRRVKYINETRQIHFGDRKYKFETSRIHFGNQQNVDAENKLNINTSTNVCVFHGSHTIGADEVQGINK